MTIFTSEIDSYFSLRAARSERHLSDWLVAVHTVELKNARLGRLQIATVRAFEGKVKILRTFTMDQEDHWDNKRRLVAEWFQQPVKEEDFQRAVGEILRQVAAQAAVEEVMGS